MRTFIFASDGCGIEYPQNSTSGLYNGFSEARTAELGFGILLHDHIPQGIAKGVTLGFELK